MIGTQAGVAAGRVTVLITNEGGNHPAKEWARATANGLVSLDPEMPEARRAAAIALRNRMYATLVEAFEMVRADSSARDLWATACGTHDRILDLSKGSPWDFEFHTDLIRISHRELIFRNLFSSADLAVRTE